MKLQKTRMVLLLIIVSALTIACGAFFRMPQRLSGSSNPQPNRREDISTVNGERLYFTAMNGDGERITYRGGPNFGGMMMGSYLTCAACHGPEARGGTHFMHMQIMYAPDIRHVALQGEMDEHGENEIVDDHGEYTLEDFRATVIEGKHPDGDPLDRDMPRWEMRDQDLRDLFEYLKTIP